jgi:DNA-binding transcriptional LysR family regulator
MDRIDTMRAFVRVMERRSFARAAQDLALPRSRISEAVQRLERDLGVPLLVRTTRSVTPTAEGETYHARAVEILAALDEAEAAVTARAPSGTLRIDVHGTFARRFLLPELPDFLARHPGIRLHIGEGDRLVDLVREGVDCVLRVGEPPDSGLVGRKLGLLPEGTFASPDYLARHGRPASPDALEGHRMIGFVSTATRAVLPFEFQVGDGVRLVTLPVAVTVTAAETSASLGKLGLGLFQAPRYRVERELGTGELVEVLADCPPTPSPVYLLHAGSTKPSPRVRSFLDWAAAAVGRRLGA